MKSIFDPATREEITKRIHSLSPGNKAQWGKMNVTQMLSHCSKCDDMMLGKIKIKRVLLGRLIGGTFLKKVLKDETAFGKNSPTSPVLKTTHEKNEDLEKQKNEWLNRISEYAQLKNADFIHPFFGRMTREQIGQFAYKHADHHLRQFGA